MKKLELTLILLGVVQISIFIGFAIINKGFNFESNIGTYSILISGVSSLIISLSIYLNKYKTNK
ncbi:MAG: hypothetical protein HRT66_08830 [Flavobacteriaceae bacterium]|nr:hypothetical protein [Flavobacteriaceae bacterium]